MLLQDKWRGRFIVGGDFNVTPEERGAEAFAHAVNAYIVPSMPHVDGTRFESSRIIDWFVASKGLRCGSMDTLLAKLSDHKICVITTNVKVSVEHRGSFIGTPTWVKPAWITSAGWRDLLEMLWKQGEHEGWPHTCQQLEEMGWQDELLHEKGQEWIDYLWARTMARICELFHMAYGIALQNVPVGG